MAWGSERESERLKAALSQLRRTIAGRSRAGLDAALADKGVPGSFGAFGIGKEARKAILGGEIFGPKSLLLRGALDGVAKSPLTGMRSVMPHDFATVFGPKWPGGMKETVLGSAGAALADPIRLGILPKGSAAAALAGFRGPSLSDLGIKQHLDPFRGERVEALFGARAADVFGAHGFRAASQNLITGFLPHGLPGLDRVRAAIEVTSRFVELWKGDPLWFLLSLFQTGDSRAFVDLDREEVYEAVFDVLEPVVRGSELTDEMNVLVGEVACLAPVQREWLTHGLQHAKAGDWVQAIPPLFAGLEGALHSSAVEAELLEPSRKGKYMGPEKIVKHIGFQSDFELFATRLAFGTRGQAFRHGRPEHEARDQALLVIVAIMGWLDHVRDSRQGRQLLANEIRAPRRLTAGSSREEPIAAA